MGNGTDASLVIGGINEDLATTVVTSEKDDSLAMEFSPLQEADKGLEYKHDTWYWWILWIPVNLVTLVIAVFINWPYRLLALRSSNLRRALGPKTINWFLGNLVHPLILTVREGVTTSAALDALYAADRYFQNYFRSFKTWGWKEWYYLPGSLLTWLVCNFPGPQSVINRLIMVYAQISDEMDMWHSRGKEQIDLLTLACGSAEATIYATYHFRRRHPETKVTLTLVDRSGSSLRRAMRLAEHLGIADSVTLVQKDLRDFLENSALLRYHIVEMVGFFDYRSYKSIIGLSRQMKSLLWPDGIFITACTAPSPTYDEFMVRYLIGWPGLMRRTKSEFVDLQLEAGWEEREVTAHMESHHIHTVVVCRRIYPVD